MEKKGSTGGKRAGGTKGPTYKHTQGAGDTKGLTIYVHRTPERGNSRPKRDKIHPNCEDRHNLVVLTV